MKNAEKRILSAFLLVAMLLTAVFALSSCNLSSLFSSSAAVSISRTEINEKGELLVIYTDGTRDNLGVVVGKNGEDGEDGEDGSDISSAEINALGELILHYSDGTQQNLGVVVGKDGADATDPPIIQDIEVNIEGSAAENVTAAVAAAAPSVVSIICNYKEDESTVSASAGAGVIYSLDKSKGDAIIITNYHVLYSARLARRADRIGVNVYGSPLDSQTITATFVGGSMAEDIAILKITNSARLRTSVAKAAVLASSDALYPGDTAIAIGNPRGEGISATYGKVNVVTETLDTVAGDNKTDVRLRVMRIDTAVNSGNSGGGVFDEEGRCIGIVNAKSIEENIENIGFALPINKVRAIVENILYFCTDESSVSPRKPTLGIEVRIVDSVAELNTQTGLFDIKQTVDVNFVEENSIARGLFAVGDRFVSVTVNDKTIAITQIHHITDSILDLRPGQTVHFTVLRGGVETVVSVTPQSNAYSPF